MSPVRGHWNVGGAQPEQLSVRQVRKLEATVVDADPMGHASMQELLPPQAPAQLKNPVHPESDAHDDSEDRQLLDAHEAHELVPYTNPSLLGVVLTTEQKCAVLPATDPHVVPA
jgi:hypothetical protein